MFTVIQTKPAPAVVKAENGLTYLDCAGDLVMLVEECDGPTNKIALRKVMLTNGADRAAPFMLSSQYVPGDDITSQVCGLIDLEILQKNYVKVD